MSSMNIDCKLFSILYGNDNCMLQNFFLKIVGLKGSNLRKIIFEQKIKKVTAVF